MRVPIGKLCSIQLGLQFRSRIEPDPQGTHQVILIRNIGPDHYLRAADEEDGGLDRVTPPTSPGRYLVRPGDVLFLARGHHNYAVPILNDFDMPTVAPGFFFILRDFASRRNTDIPQVLPEYLAWAINRPEAQESLRLNARRGSHMPLVGKADLGTLEIPVPELEIQRKVVHVDRLRRREREIEQLIASKREALVQRVCERAASHR